MMSINFLREREGEEHKKSERLRAQRTYKSAHSLMSGECLELMQRHH